MTTQDEIRNGLNAAGIGENVQDEFRAGHEAIAKFSAELFKRASAQLTHNLLQNGPMGLDIGGSAGQHAVECGVISALSALVEWDINQARRLAAELLQDVNDHSTAKMLYELTEGE